METSREGAPASDITLWPPVLVNLLMLIGASVAVDGGKLAQEWGAQVQQEEIERSDQDRGQLIQQRQDTSMPR